MIVFYEIAVLLSFQTFIELKKGSIFAEVRQMFLYACLFGTCAGFLVYTYTNHVQLSILVGSLLAIVDIFSLVIKEVLSIVSKSRTHPFLFIVRCIVSLLLSYYLLSNLI